MTVDPRALTVLANRCEDEEPSRELEQDIFQAVGGPLWDKAYVRAQEPCGCPPDMAIEGARRYAPPFLTSVDAAKLLMPEGWRVQEISECPSAAGIPGWLVFVQSDTQDFIGGWAETEAPARCAAALNARAGYDAYMAADEERRYPKPPEQERDAAHDPDDDLPF